MGLSSATIVIISSTGQHALHFFAIFYCHIFPSNSVTRFLFLAVLLIFFFLLVSGSRRMYVTPPELH